MRAYLADSSQPSPNRGALFCRHMPCLDRVVSMIYINPRVAMAPLCVPFELRRAAWKLLPHGELLYTN